MRLVAACLALCLVMATGASAAIVVQAGSSVQLPTRTPPTVYPVGQNAALVRSVWGRCGTSGTVYQYRFMANGPRDGAFTTCNRNYTNLSGAAQHVSQ